MGLTSHLLAVAVGVAGATAYQRAMQGGTNDDSPRRQRFTTGNGALDDASNGSSVDGGGASALGESVDSPNAGERLNAQGPVSDDAPDSLRQADNLFAPSSADGSQARTPGLPDFARGA